MVQSAPAELAGGRTTLVIARRLTTVRPANRIAVVDRDGVGEQGTHAELVGAGRAYQRLHEA